MDSVLNHDVAGLHQRMNRFISEMVKSVSSSVSRFGDHDVARLMSYLEAVRFYHDWVVSQPHLDLPETHPRHYALKENPSVPDLENESVKDVIRMMELARDELTHSQSSRMPSGLISFDSNRLMALVEKCEAFIQNYVRQATPLDLPESSPQTPVSGPGRTGI